MKRAILLLAFVAMPAFAQVPPEQKTAIEDFQKKNAKIEADKKACRAAASKAPVSSPARVVQEQALVYTACMTKLGYDVQ